MNNLCQSKHEQGEHGHPIMNSVFIVYSVHHSKHKQLEYDQSNMNSLEHLRHEQHEYDQPIVNSLQQSKHEPGEHDQPIVNSVD